MQYVFVCDKKNELYNLARKTNNNIERSDTISLALEKIIPESVLCIFEDTYPQKKNIITKHTLDLLKSKKIKVIIEYPKEVYNLQKNKVIKLDKERIVDIKSLNIGQNNCHYIIPYDIDSKYIRYTFAKVAGYKKAVYGLPNENYPYIFYHPDYSNVQIVTSKISSPITSRFKPISFFEQLYKKVFNLDITYLESVKASYTKEQKINQDDVKNTINRSTNWFKKYMLTYDMNGTQVYEGFTSNINCDGTQTMASTIRTDCIGEASLVFALDFLLKDNKSSKKTSEELLKYIFQDINQELDMSKDFGGFIKWYGKGEKIYYADDDARVLLGTITSANILKTNKHNEGMIKSILAYLRSMPEKGIYINCLRFNDKMIVDDFSWDDIKTKVKVNYSPHYVSYLWAAFLLVYEITKDSELLEISKKGILEMMSKYPDGWLWTNGIMAEVSRMVLPLSLLYKFDKDIRIKKHLDTLFNVIIEQTNESGCMIEKMILLENGKYLPPKCNNDYGRYEAPIIHDNGDQACDLLYSQNFAYLGLHEAYYSTNDIKYKHLADKMTEFLVKIQTKSDVHKELDGVWMRSFDPTMWEYYGSGADTGWAALCVESGWTNSWINIVMSLREQNKSLLDFTDNKSDFHDLYWKIKDTLK
ncbi:MAG: hypothetical protein KAG94_02180 [Clostridiales bacterium]|nr:hypothetical protein [Clostridiales bacterium]